MTELRQRQPRIKEPKYLAWLRKQNCACGCGKPPPSDAAHLRATSLPYGKEFTGSGKPHDRWAMPLNRSCHMRQHAHGDEVGFWAAHGIPDPFGRAMRYYSAWFAQAATEPQERRSAPKPRKPKAAIKSHRKPRGGAGWPTKQPNIANRKFPKTKRKFRT